MKKHVIAIAALLFLTGCGSVRNEKQASDEAETTSVTSAVTTGTTAAETSSTAVTTAAKRTNSKTATAQTTTAAASAGKTSAGNKSGENSGQSDKAPEAQTEAAVQKHYTSYGEEIPEAEWNGICKVGEKYGIDFEVISRFLCWESWPEKVYDEDGTEHIIGRYPSDPMSVYYGLRCSDGTEFDIYVNENTDVVTTDSYLFVKYRERFNEEAGELYRKLVPGCKVNLRNVVGTALPFECSADMTYEEFLQAFIDNDGYVRAKLYITDGMEIPDGLDMYRSRDKRRKRGELGYYCSLTVGRVSQEVFDRFEDVSADIVMDEAERVF